MKKRIEAYDLMRVIVTLNVIIIHITARAFIAFKPMSFQALSVIFLNRIVKFSVPVFIFLSGALIYESIKNKPLNYPQFIKKKIKYIYFPYLIFATIYYFAVLVKYHHPMRISDYLTQLLLGSAYSHLYFIPIIMQLFLLTPAFIFLRNKINKHVLLVFALILSFLSVLFLNFDYSDRLFIKYLTPFLIGLYYGDEVKKLNNIVNILAVNMVMIVSYAWLYMKMTSGMMIQTGVLETLWFINSVLTCISLLFILDKVSNKKVRHIANDISEKAYYIYLIHPLIIGLVVDFVGNDILNGSGMIFLILITCILSYIASKIIKRFQEKLGF